MNKIKFSNSDLQRDSLGDVLDLNPEDIIAEHDSNSEQPHILVIGTQSYFYLEEHNRDHDRDLAMALLLISLQDDGIQINSMIDGDEILTDITNVNEDIDGSIYVTVIDQESDYFDIPVTALVCNDYEIPAASPATVEKDLSNLSKPTLAEREDAILKNQTKPVRLGDYVETEFHGHKGRVTGIAQYFGDTIENEAWFTRQEPAYKREQKMERWISILCHNGGSVMVAESRVKLIEKFDFTNPYAEEYFRD